MRRWLPIALLLAIAGVVVPILRWRSNRVEPVAAELTPAHAVPADAEHAVESEGEVQRAPLAPPGETTTVGQPDPSAAHLTVRVVGMTSHGPVARVRVILSPVPVVPGLGLRNVEGTEGDMENSPITGSDGIVRFELPPAREFSLRLRNEDERFLPAGTQLPDSTSVGGHVSVRFERPVAIRVSGQKSDETSVIVPGLLADEARELVLEIEDGLDGHVVGKVVCAETGDPVSGARVRVLLGGRVRTEWHTPGPDERTTGNDGRFELSFALRSDPLLCVEAVGYGLRYASLDKVHTDLAHALVVNVSRAATLSARVLDASGGPIEGAWVELSTEGNLLAHHDADDQGFFSSGISFSFPPDEHWRALTGPDGRARIEGLPPRVEISVEVEKAVRRLYREPTGLTLQPGEVKELVWRIGSGTLVHGLALDQDGKPVAGLEIWVAKASPVGGRLFMHHERERVDRKTTSDGEGRFTIEDLAPGQWSIGPGVKEGGSCAPTAEPLEITGEPALELTLHVYRGLLIRGRVLTPNGEGAQNSWVNGLAGPGDRPEGVRTGKDGSFAYGPLAPGTITLTAVGTGRFAPSPPVQASAGDSGVVLQLQQGGVVRGRVVDGVTGAATPAQLVLAAEQDSTGGYAGLMQTMTKPDGSFSCDGLAAGRWSVTASTAEGKFAQHAHLEVGAGSDSGELVFALSPGGRLRLGYKGAEPRAFVTVTREGAAVLWQSNVEAGKFVESMAPAGSLVLEIRKAFAGPARTRVVELGIGETKEVLLRDED